MPHPYFWFKVVRKKWDLFSEVYGNSIASSLQHKFRYKHIQVCRYAHGSCIKCMVRSECNYRFLKKSHINLYWYMSGIDQYYMYVMWGPRRQETNWGSILTCRLAVERNGVMVGRIFPKASCRLSWSASSSLPVTLTSTGSRPCA